MLNLVLCIIFASVFTLCIKWVQVRRQEDIIVVGAIGYIVAMVCSLPEYLQYQSAGDPRNAWYCGILMGSCYFVAFFFVIHTIRSVGVSSTTVISVLSILLPIACGTLIWNEHPNAYQFVGIIVALSALVLVGGQREPIAIPGPSWKRLSVMVVFFLLAGLARLAQAAFKHTSLPDQRPAYLFSAFLITAIPSLGILLVRRLRFTPTEFGIGTLMGLANVLQTHFILQSLQQFEGFLVFPVTSAGALIFTTVVATRMLGERLRHRTYVGISLTVVALVLLNFTPTSS